MRFVHQLSEEKIRNERLSNKLYKASATSTFTKVEEEIIANQLNSLYASINGLSDKKFVEDKFMFQIQELQEKTV